jgi:hypothetical protein
VRPKNYQFQSQPLVLEYDTLTHERLHADAAAAIAARQRAAGRPVEIPARRVAAIRVGEVLKRALASRPKRRRRVTGKTAEAEPQPAAEARDEAEVDIEAAEAGEVSPAEQAEGAASEEKPERKEH